jgi:hypothetical protein
MAGRAGLSGWWGGPWPPPPGGAVTPSRNPCPEGAGALGRGVAPPPGEGPSARARARAKRRGHLLGRAAREGGPKAGRGGPPPAFGPPEGGGGPKGWSAAWVQARPGLRPGRACICSWWGRLAPPAPPCSPQGCGAALEVGSVGPPNSLGGASRACCPRPWPHVEDMGRICWPPQLAGGGIAGLLPATLQMALARPTSKTRGRARPHEVGDGGMLARPGRRPGRSPWTAQRTGPGQGARSRARGANSPARSASHL